MPIPLAELSSSLDSAVITSVASTFVWNVTCATSSLIVSAWLFVSPSVSVLSEPSRKREYSGSSCGVSRDGHSCSPLDLSRPTASSFHLGHWHSTRRNRPVLVLYQLNLSHQPNQHLVTVACPVSPTIWATWLFLILRAGVFHLPVLAHPGLLACPAGLTCLPGSSFLCVSLRPTCFLYISSLHLFTLTHSLQLNVAGLFLLLSLHQGAFRLFRSGVVTLLDSLLDTPLPSGVFFSLVFHLDPWCSSHSQSTAAGIWSRSPLRTESSLLSFSKGPDWWRKSSILGFIRVWAFKVRQEFVLMFGEVVFTVSLVFQD